MFLTVSCIKNDSKGNRIWPRKESFPDSVDLDLLSPIDGAKKFRVSARWRYPFSQDNSSGTGAEGEWYCYDWSESRNRSVFDKDLRRLTVTVECRRNQEEFEKQLNDKRNEKSFVVP